MSRKVRSLVLTIPEIICLGNVLSYLFIENYLKWNVSNQLPPLNYNHTSYESYWWFYTSQVSKPWVAYIAVLLIVLTIAYLVVKMISELNNFDNFFTRKESIVLGVLPLITTIYLIVSSISITKYWDSFRSTTGVWRVVNVFPSFLMTFSIVLMIVVVILETCRLFIPVKD